MNFSLTSGFVPLALWVILSLKLKSMLEYQPVLLCLPVWVSQPVLPYFSGRRSDLLGLSIANKQNSFQSDAKMNRNSLGCNVCNLPQRVHWELSWQPLFCPGGWSLILRQRLLSLTFTFCISTSLDSRFLRIHWQQHYCAMFTLTIMHSSMARAGVQWNIPVESYLKRKNKIWKKSHFTRSRFETVSNRWYKLKI